MKNKKWIFLLVLLNISYSFADGTYFIPGSGEKDKNQSGELEDDENSKLYFIPNTVKEKMMELDEQQILWAIPQQNTTKMDESLQDKDLKTDDHFIMESQKGSEYQAVETKRKSTINFDQLPQGSPEIPKDKYIESDGVARMSQYRNKGQTAFTFTLFYDSNTYTDARGVYDKTFTGDGTEWYNNFWAIFSSEFYIFKSFFNFALGGNLGGSYKSGYGVFTTNDEQSDTKFSLITVPLDFSIIFEFNLWNWVRVEAFGGPSVMALIQNRNDREKDENDKVMGQVSFGYFAGARFKLSLGMIFPETNKPMFETNDVTNYFVNFDVRYQSYSNFKQDDIEVSGISAGLGLSFEFL